MELTLSAPVKPSFETASNPDRILLDLPDTASNDNLRSVAVNANGVRRVRTGQHNEQWLARFAAAVVALPEVQEFHRMSGDVDYLLKVVTTDIDGYDRFYKKLIKAVHLTGVSSAFSMEQIKFTTALPLDLVAHGTSAAAAG